MTDIEAKRDHNRSPNHPGEVLRDMLEDIDLSKTELAERLLISRQQLYDILNTNKPVSPAVAGKLGRLFGNGSGLWLRLQANYDAWHADRDEGLNKIIPLSA